jgi:hypothetical protein
VGGATGAILAGGQLAAMVTVAAAHSQDTRSEYTSFLDKKRAFSIDAYLNYARYQW